MHAARVLIAESHDAMRRALRAAVMERVTWGVCAEATTAGETLAKTAELMPDVVLLDIGLPGLDSLELTHELRRIASATKVLVLSVYESTPLAEHFRDAGAHGYLIKSDAGRALGGAIDALLEGRTFFSDHMQRNGAELTGDRRDMPVPVRNRLTEREREVLQLLAGGKSNKEVAVALSISVKTVETHRARIMNKLNLHSMTELVRYAIRNRLIDA